MYRGALTRYIHLFLKESDGVWPAGDSAGHVHGCGGEEEAPAILRLADFCKLLQIEAGMRRSKETACQRSK